MWLEDLLIESCCQFGAMGGFLLLLRQSGTGLELVKDLMVQQSFCCWGLHHSALIKRSTLFSTNLHWTSVLSRAAPAAQHFWSFWFCIQQNCYMLLSTLGKPKFCIFMCCFIPNTGNVKGFPSPHWQLSSSSSSSSSSNSSSSWPWYLTSLAAPLWMTTTNYSRSNSTSETGLN